MLLRRDEYLHGAHGGHRAEPELAV